MCCDATVSADLHDLPLLAAKDYTARIWPGLVVDVDALAVVGVAGGYSHHRGRIRGRRARADGALLVGCGGVRAAVGIGFAPCSRAARRPVAAWCCSSCAGPRCRCWHVASGASPGRARRDGGGRGSVRGHAPPESGGLSPDRLGCNRVALRQLLWSHHASLDEFVARQLTLGAAGRRLSEVEPNVRAGFLRSARPRVDLLDPDDFVDRTEVIAATATVR